jgi:PAS domain S-box-containing protein
MTVAAAAGAYALLGGLVTLAGWAFDVPVLTSWKNDGIAMFPNTAACAVLGGLTILLHDAAASRWRTARVVLPTVMACIGGLTLFEHVTGIDLHIDRALFDRPWGLVAAAAPLRMGPPASVSFLVIGAALVLLDRDARARRATPALAVAVMAIATLSLIGHLYGAEPMYMIPRLTGIAMQAATMILALAAGTIACVPEREPMRTLLAPTAAGMLVRRALPVAVVLAVTLGAVRIAIEEHGLVDAAFGTALRTLVEVVLLTAVLWWAAAMVRAHEDALRASEAEVRRQAGQLAAFLDTAAICLHRVGPDGTILWANEAELETFGYARDEYVGRRIAEFHADPTVIADMLARLHAGEKLVEYPARITCKDGSLKSVLVDSTVYREDGRFIHTQCFTRDVTERQNAEQARALLAAIIETSDDAIISKALDGTITSWNASAERMYGYVAAEVIGRSIDVIVPPDRRDEDREILRRLRAGERIEHLETVRRAKDGRLLDVSLTISPVKDESGRIVGASKVARDITDRKRAEAERQESNRRKDEFIAILAHELRNPLAPVRNAVRYLRLRGPTDAELRRPIDMIERQVAQMARLIDDLLDVSRISRGTLELRRERVTPAEVVEAALDACRDDIDAKAQVLRVELPAEPIELDADRERLVQILSNLLSNATRYTPAGGHIDVHVATLDARTVEILVRDDGLGIPPGKLTEIFDLFARVDQSLERQGGLGIGLTLVRQLVELHGGTIEARSQGIGHGSEFVVRLPVVAPTPRAAASPESRPEVPPLRILIADDNVDAVDSLALLLRMGGHEVHAVYDGEAALAAAAKLRPQVALLDIGMPGATGYEVARRIRQQPWGRRMLLVALTGWGQDADKRSAEQAGFDAHLVKPVPLEAVEQLLAGVAGGAAASTARSGVA